ncbi:hypothetical protein [Halarsenatibacter silvermanii]|nr:hypothetical protein [Halarsenatibacter silvermanii]
MKTNDNENKGYEHETLYIFCKKKARAGLKEGETSDNIIDKDIMEEYFYLIKLVVRFYNAFQSFC